MPFQTYRLAQNTGCSLVLDALTKRYERFIHVNNALTMR